jgi:hypothetical protein
MKIFIISLDMLVALPVLSLAAMFLFSSARGTQSYLLSLGGAYGSRLDAITASQQISQSIDSGTYNYSSASQAASSVAGEYGLAAQVIGLDAVQRCGGFGEICRIVIVSGRAYVLVVSYENASKP